MHRGPPQNPLRALGGRDFGSGGVAEYAYTARGALSNERPYRDL